MKLDYSPAERADRSVRRLVIVASLCVVGLATLVSRESIANRHVSPTSNPIPDVQVAEAVAYEQAVQSAVSDPLVVPPASEWTTLTVKSGETLSTLFDDEGISADQWMEMVALSGDAKQLKRIKTGDKIELRKNGDQVEELRYAFDELRTLDIQRVDDHFEATTLTAEVERRVKTVTGVIDSSLFSAGQKSGLPMRMVMELAELFRYDIDFALDLRDGDRFTVVHEELYKDGEKLRDGDMLAAEFINQGKVHRAVRFVDEDGHAAFYTPDGQSLRKAFFRTPLDVIRVTSPFDLHRRHPILNTIRAHKGTDYAAAEGTPIKATGDGKVEFEGMKNGYGRVVEIQHGAQYETVYAHMSKFRAGLTVGSRVKQGQIIGYVGMSGLATAPHLHYEFLVNGNQVNPQNIVMPRANPIGRQQMTAFHATAAPLVAAIVASKNAAMTAQAAEAAPVPNAPVAGTAATVLQTATPIAGAVALPK